MIRPPAHIAWLVEAVGQDAALAFVEANAGRRISVPLSARGSKLASLYGEGVASALCAQYGDDRYDVPACKPWRIRVYADMGMTVGDIALRAGVSRPSVYKYLSQDEALAARRRARRTAVDTRQMDLLGSI